MKVFFLYLLIIVGDSYAAVKIPIGFTLRPITCEEAFYNNVKFVKNKNHKQYEPLTYAIYKNYHVFGHYCKDLNNNYYMGYEEQLNYDLGHDK